MRSRVFDVLQRSNRDIKIYYFELKVQFDNNLWHNNYGEKSGKTRKLILNNSFILFIVVYVVFKYYFSKINNISVESEL